jgi:hypothetical protein
VNFLTFIEFVTLRSFIAIGVGGLCAGCLSQGTLTPQTTGSDASIATPALQLFSVNPSAGFVAGGTLITLSGNAFTNDLQIKLDVSLCTNKVLISPTLLTCINPSHSAGTVSISVINSTGTALLLNGFTYVSDPAPTVTAITPNNGGALGGTIVTITGTDFRTNATARVGGVNCIGVENITNTSLTCTTGEHPVGSSLPVQVNNSDGTQSANFNGFTFNSTGTETFTNLTNTILNSKCLSCHGGAGGLFTNNYTSVRARVSNDFKPETSTLFIRVNASGGSAMPPGGPALSTGEKEVLKSWILGGALNN